jgi:DNA-binding transcriptional LysR family regulator
VAAKRAPAIRDWENLRFFLEARRAGSLSKASTRLRVDHTTVSRRIAALEASLGVRLFDRGPRGYEPTRIADELFSLAETLEAQVLAIERHARLGTDHAGVVRIATTEQIAAAFVIPAIPALRARHPAIVLEVSADNRDVSLARREADLAVRYGRPKEPGLVGRKLGELEHAFYAARSGRGAAALDLETDAFVGYDDSLGHVEPERWLERVAPRRRVVFRANSLLCLRAAVRAGLGVALMPCFFGDSDPTLERLRSELAPPPRELWVVVHEELRRSPRVRAVLDFLIAFAGGARAGART